MPTNPSWLPQIIELVAFGGDFFAYQDHLYSLFTKDFITSHPTLGGFPVLATRKQVDGKCETFWHFTTETDYISGDRNTRLERCERICWVRPMVENLIQPEIVFWKKPHKRGERLYFFLPDFCYLLVVAKGKDRYYLTTAYYIDYEHRKNTYLAEALKYNPKNTKTAL
jgi:hypothetical protein